MVKAVIDLGKGIFTHGHACVALNRLLPLAGSSLDRVTKISIESH